MTKEEVLRWNGKYDKQNPWWTSEETKLGDKFRRNGYLTKDDLCKVVEWKFKQLPGRKKRVLKFINGNDEAVVRHNSSLAFSLPIEKEGSRINYLDDLLGVGPALASTILAFYDPRNYCVHDIHVWREVFGPEPVTLFTGNRCYLQLLKKLRAERDKYGLDVRILEKAYFTKNFC